jgi:hypothetical protein
VTPEKNDELVFLPLGGSDEIGMNLNAYGYGPPDDRKWIIIDIGVTFAGADAPGIEVILPDPAYLEECRKDILGVVLTHAHEDHIGAIGWLWPRLKAPIFATPFTAALVREKLRERGLLDKAPLKEVPLGGKFTLGPFELELVTLTHSIPEPNGLAIRTPLGIIWHTGDWKIDPDPLIGEKTDVAALTRLAEEGVLAMICDSTNVFVEGEAGSEAEVAASWSPPSPPTSRAWNRRSAPGRPAGARSASSAARCTRSSPPRKAWAFCATCGPFSRRRRRRLSRPRGCFISAPAARASRAPRSPASPLARTATCRWARATRSSSPRASSPATRPLSMASITPSPAAAWR